MWNFSDDESDCSGPVRLVRKFAASIVSNVAAEAASKPPLPLLPCVADRSSAWAPILRQVMRRRGVLQSRSLKVESALSGTLGEAAIYKATIVRLVPSPQSFSLVPATIYKTSSTRLVPSLVEHDTTTNYIFCSIVTAHLHNHMYT